MENLAHMNALEAPKKRDRSQPTSTIPFHQLLLHFETVSTKFYGNTSLDPIIEVLKLLAATSTLRSMSFNGYGPKPCRAKHRPLANIAKVVSLVPSYLSKFAA